MRRNEILVVLYAKPCNAHPIGGVAEIVSDGESYVIWRKHLFVYDGVLRFPPLTK